MDVIFKAFSGLFFMMVLMITGISVLFASVDSANADSFATAAANRIRVSYFDREVIEECIRDARARDYVLTVDVYRDEYTNECYGVTDLAYVYAIPVFGIGQTMHVTSEIY